VCECVFVGGIERERVCEGESVWERERRTERNRQREKETEIRVRKNER